jgi:hypothetical protein
MTVPALSARAITLVPTVVVVSLFLAIPLASVIDVRTCITETGSLGTLETAPTGGDPWRAPAPEGPHVLQRAKPLIASSDRGL